MAGNVQGMGVTVAQALQSIQNIGLASIGMLRFNQAQARANRNFATTTAFFAIILTAVLGYYLLAATFLAIVLGLYFLM